MNRENKTQLQDLTAKAKAVVENYKKTYPDVQIGKDYLPFKIIEEWGECLQAYLMLTDRGRQKGKDKEEIKILFAEEFADVFAYLLLFAEEQDIDLAGAFEKKWLQYL